VAGWVLDLPARSPRSEVKDGDVMTEQQGVGYFGVWASDGYPPMMSDGTLRKVMKAEQDEQVEELRQARARESLFGDYQTRALVASGCWRSSGASGTRRGRSWLVRRAGHRLR
jgi:hypothetical protein